MDRTDTRATIHQQRAAASVRADVLRPRGYESRTVISLLKGRIEKKIDLAAAAVAAGMDVAATALSLMGLDGYGEGRPLSANADRKKMFCEAFRIYEGIPTWASLRSSNWKYIHYDTDEQELYRLRRDPLELENVADEFPRRVRKFRKRVDAKRGLTVMGADNNDRWEVPPVQKGVAVERPFAAIGGQPPYVWSLIVDERYIRNSNDEYLDRIPDGFSVTSDGVLVGTPTEAGLFEFFVEVTDQSKTKYRGGPQRFAGLVRLPVLP